jgi:hypothetical protein
MMVNNHSEPHASRAKPLFSSLQPDAQSAIPQAGRGPTHRRRAVAIAAVVIIIIILAFLAYYLLTVGSQSS